MREAVLNETDPEDIPALIRDADGIEELYSQRKLKENGRKSALMRRDQSPSSVNLSDGDSEQGDDDAQDNDDGDDDNVKGIVARPDIEGRNLPRVHASVSSLPSKSERERRGKPLLFDKKKDLAVTFPSPEELYELLASQAAGGSLDFRLGDIGDKPRKVFMIRCTLNA